MDDLKLNRRARQIREKILFENEWYTYLGKYHIYKKVIDFAVEHAKKPDSGVGSIHSWQMPLGCKEKIPNRSEMKKLFLAIKDHMSTMVGIEFNVDYLESKKRNGEFSAFVLIRKKPKKSKLDSYFRMLKEMDNER